MDTMEGNCPTLLWVDLSQLESSNSSANIFIDKFNVKLLEAGKLEKDSVTGNHPDGLVFEFDYPDRAGLSVLRQTKHQFPSLPIVMISEQHSESLIAWALRMRLWSYLVKPVTPAQVQELHNELVELKRVKQFKDRRLTVQRDESIPVEYCTGEKMVQENLLQRAIEHIEAHLSEKIPLDAMAELCHMSPFRFSRLFKKTYEANFQDYLVLRRIKEAMRMLGNPSASVADIACLVGFKDSSYFAKTFKKHTGLNPIAYRERVLAEHKSPSLPPEQPEQRLLFLYRDLDD